MRITNLLTIVPLFFGLLSVHADVPLVANDCDELDFSNVPENNPGVLQNPNEVCDVGLELPGLPTYGLSFKIPSFDSCALLKGVVADVSQELNVNDRIQKIYQTAEDKLGKEKLAEATDGVITAYRESNNGQKIFDPKPVAVPITGNLYNLPTFDAAAFQKYQESLNNGSASSDEEAPVVPYFPPQSGSFYNIGQ